MRPKCFGSLGILDLDLFCRALHLRWLWFEWTSPERLWVGTEPPVNAVDRQLFRASTIVTLGDGAKASFWQSSYNIQLKKSFVRLWTCFLSFSS